MKVENSFDTLRTIRAHRMESGQVGVLRDGTYIGKHLLMTFNGLVMLENPGKTWRTNSDNDTPSFDVNVLPIGTKITLEVE